LFIKKRRKAMKAEGLFFLIGLLFILCIGGINSKNTSETNINHYQLNSNGETVKLTVAEKGATSCEVVGCGFMRNKTSCNISCNGSQSAICGCNCVKITTFGTCLELRESCKCE
jgi:hypothetical protein